MNCPKCGVGLSRHETLIGCPLCEWDPNKPQARPKGGSGKGGSGKGKGQSKAVKAAPSRDDVWAQILDHPVYGYATRLFRHLMDQYQGEVPTWASNPVIWRNRQGSCHTYYPHTHTHQIVFGYASVTESHDKRMREYSSWSWIWNRMEGVQKGLAGVYQEVVHEFAHALQIERGGRQYGAVHTDTWANAVLEILELVPFEDTLQLAR